MEMIIALGLIASSVAIILCEASSYKMTYNEVAKELKGKRFIF